MVSDCLQQNWRMIQRWIRWSLGGHQWFNCRLHRNCGCQFKTKGPKELTMMKYRAEKEAFFAMSPGCEVPSGELT